MATLSFYEETIHGVIQAVARNEFQALRGSSDAQVKRGALDLIKHLGVRLQRLDHSANVPQLVSSEPAFHQYIDGYGSRTVAFFAMRPNSNGQLDDLVVLGCFVTVSAQAHTTDIQTALGRFHSLPGPWL